MIKISQRAIGSQVYFLAGKQQPYNGNSNLQAKLFVVIVYFMQKESLKLMFVT